MVDQDGCDDKQIPHHRVLTCVLDPNLPVFHGCIHMWLGDHVATMLNLKLWIGQIHSCSPTLVVRLVTAWAIESFELHCSRQERIATQGTCWCHTQPEGLTVLNGTEIEDSLFTLVWLLGHGTPTPSEHRGHGFFPKMVQVDFIH